MYACGRGGVYQRTYAKHAFANLIRMTSSAKPALSMSSPKLKPPPSVLVPASATLRAIGFPVAVQTIAPRGVPLTMSLVRHTEGDAETVVEFFPEGELLIREICVGFRGIVVILSSWVKGALGFVSETEV